MFFLPSPVGEELFNLQTNHPPRLKTYMAPEASSPLLLPVSFVLSLQPCYLMSGSVFKQSFC